MSNNNITSNNKSCYRLYAGHGNWINLSAKTTQDLLQIFREGIPCRYPLSAGLAIDIIPNDVDCNSKNINMFGLMRADLVYENQSDENHVQQLMSHYIRSLLDEQGIIDAFPPPRAGEDLPIVTSIPTHRHLSLVPSVLGAVRRGPKPSSYKKQSATTTTTNSSSSSAAPGSLVSSVSSSSASSPSRGCKRSYTIPNKRNNSAINKRSTSSSQISKNRQQILSNSILPAEVNHVQLFDHSQAHYMNMNPTSSAPPTTKQHEDYHHHHHQNQHYGMLPMTFSHQQEHQEQQQHQQQHQQHHIWSFQPQNSSATRSTTNLFNFEFNMELDQQQQGDEEEERRKQSSTDILQEYEFTQRGFDGGELYANSILEEDHHLPNSTSDSTDSYAPASPNFCWTTAQYKKSNSKATTETASTIDSPTTTTTTAVESQHFFKSNKDLEQVTTLPMDCLLLSSSNNGNNNNNNGNLILSHVGDSS